MNTEPLLELRIYECVDGRRDQAVATLRAIAGDLFVRHGVRPLGFWETNDGDKDELVYMLQWTDAMERETTWAALHADPAWTAGMERVRQQGASIAARFSRLLTPMNGFEPVAEGRA